MLRLAAGRCADIALAALVAAPALAVTGWAVQAGQSPPWPALAVLGVAAASMCVRRTRPAAAALVTSVAYVISVQSGSAPSFRLPPEYKARNRYRYPLPGPRTSGPWSRRCYRGLAGERRRLAVTLERLRAEGGTWRRW
jgi:hypothetical protein